MEYLKITTSILRIISLFLVISPDVFGQNVEISIPPTSGAPGDIVTIPVNIGETQGRGIIAAEITLEYDPLVLSAVDANGSGTIASAWYVFANAAIPGEVSVSMAGMDPLIGSGALVNIKFLVQPTAEIGFASVLRFTKARLNEGTPGAVPKVGIFTVEHVSTGDRLAGDVDGDDRVDHRDLLKLVLAYSKRTGEISFNPWADFNKDGTVDKDDMIILWKNFGSKRE